MDSHTHSLLPERFEVIEVGRRRRWSEEEKLRIMMECLEAPRLVSATARYSAAIWVRLARRLG